MPCWMLKLTGCNSQTLRLPQRFGRHSGSAGEQLGITVFNIVPGNELRFFYPTVLRIHFHTKRLVKIRESELVKSIFFIHGHLLEVQGFFRYDPNFLTLLLYYEMLKYSVIQTFFSDLVVADQTLVTDHHFKWWVVIGPHKGRLLQA